MVVSVVDVKDHALRGKGLSGVEGDLLAAFPVIISQDRVDILPSPGSRSSKPNLQIKQLGGRGGRGL